MRPGVTPGRGPRRGPTRVWCTLLLVVWLVVPSPLTSRRCRVMSPRSVIRGLATTPQPLRQALVGWLVPGTMRRWPSGCR